MSDKGAKLSKPEVNNVETLVLPSNIEKVLKNHFKAMLNEEGNGLNSKIKRIIQIPTRHLL